MRSQVTQRLHDKHAHPGVSLQVSRHIVFSSTLPSPSRVSTFDVSSHIQVARSLPDAGQRATEDAEKFTQSLATVCSTGAGQPPVRILTPHRPRQVFVSLGKPALEVITLSMKLGSLMGPRQVTPLPCVLAAQLHRFRKRKSSFAAPAVLLVFYSLRLLGSQGLTNTRL